MSIQKRIKVLQFICPSGFYGAEMWILALASHLNPAKIECSLAITHESSDQNLELYKRFDSLGLKSHKIPMNGRFDIRCVTRLVKLIKKNRIDILHTHGYKSDILGLVAARIAGITIVSTPHGFENSSDRKLQLYIRLGCFSLRFFDKVVPLSPDLKQDCLNISVSPDKVRLIVNGVELREIEGERLNEAVPLYPNNRDKIIGYVGQMAPRKNVDALLSAFDLIYQENPEVRLILIGDGSQRKRLEERARKLESGSQIEFLGFRDDRLRLMKQMDIFSMTSSLEGIPRCVMEAMAIGTPVVAFNIPGIDELLIDGETGLLADFNDVQGLKRCWGNLLSNRALALRIKKNARQHILEKFSAHRMASEYTSLYREEAFS